MQQLIEQVSKACFSKFKNTSKNRDDSEIKRMMSIMSKKNRKSPPTDQLATATPFKMKLAKLKLKKYKRNFSKESKLSLDKYAKDASIMVNNRENSSKISKFKNKNKDTSDDSFFNAENESELDSSKNELGNDRTKSERFANLYVKTKQYKNKDNQSQIKNTTSGFKIKTTLAKTFDKNEQIKQSKDLEGNFLI